MNLVLHLTHEYPRLAKLVHRNSTPELLSLLPLQVCERLEFIKEILRENLIVLDSKPFFLRV